MERGSQVGIMAHEDLKAALRGVAFTTPTPFTGDAQDVACEHLRSHARWLEDAGARGVVPCGNTGEYYSLTDTERTTVVAETVDAREDDATVIAGVGGSLHQARALADAYAEAGADGVMVMDPDHTYVHAEGLYDYYEGIASATDLGVVLYKRSDLLSRDLITRLAEVENVVGLKFAVNDVDAFSAVAGRVGDDLVLTTGIAERFAPAFALEGAEGFTSGIGGFAPGASLALMDALRAEDWARARRIRDRIRPYEDLREEPGANNAHPAANNVPAVKYGLELAGHYGGPVRPPLVGLAEEDRRRAEEYYHELADIDPAE
jgi:4-hydroxy-tetrahydrodipicolinate synthase